MNTSSLPEVDPIQDNFSLRGLSCDAPNSCGKVFAYEKNIASGEAAYVGLRLIGLVPSHGNSPNTMAS